MKKFNWEEFLDRNNKIAVHCKTEEEAKDFCNQMNEHGLKWCSEISYIKDTYFEVYKSRTCYDSKGKYAYDDYYEEERYKILEWSDYMKKEFTKADLKDGMVVEYRDGKRRLVVAEKLIGKDGHSTLKPFNENLENINFMEHTIVKIYEIKYAAQLSCILDDENLELIWERTETKHMTLEEMRQKLEELTGEKIKIEPSMEEMIGTIKIHCNDKPCETCILNNKCLATNIYDMTKEQLKQCYKEVREDE